MMSPKHVSTYLLAALLALAVAHSANARLTLDSEFITLAVNNDTGAIEMVAITAGSTASEESVIVFNHGNLLSLEGAGRAKLQYQEMRKDARGGDLIASVYDAESGISIERRLSLGDAPYTLRISYKLENLSSNSVAPAGDGTMRLLFAQGFEGRTDARGGYASSIYSYLEPFFSQADDPSQVQRLEAQSLGTLAPVGWIGWLNRYHVIALRVAGDGNPAAIRLDSLLQSDASDNGITTPGQVGIFLDNTRLVQPGQFLEFNFVVVVAPRSEAVLASIEPHLDGTVLMNLWNWFRWVCLVLGQLLLYLFSFTHNWGVTLILMALLIRLVTMPVTRISLQYQERAAAQQERMQPLLRSIKEKYSGLELSQQMVDLYEKEDFDHLLPFKSMLGLFIQIPVLIALFNVLAEIPELGNASFLWISDLSASDRLFPLGVNLPFFGGYFNLLPFVMAFVTVISTYYARRVKGSVKGDLQYGALFGMAGAFFVLFYTFPAALVLYWTASNFFQLLQQLIDNRLA